MEPLLTTEEAAAVLRVSAVTLKRWRARREGPAWTPTGRRVGYTREAVRDWIQGQTVDLKTQ